MGSPSILGVGVETEVVHLVVDDPQYLSAVPVGLEKRIYSSFDDRAVQINKCMFTRMGLGLPFSDFEVVVPKYLKVSPS